MKKYRVYLTRIECFEVEAENSEEAIDAVLHGGARSISEDTVDATTEEVKCPQCGGTGEYTSEAQARTPDPIMHKCDTCGGKKEVQP